MPPIFHAIQRNDVLAFLRLVLERESRLEERSEEQHSNTVLHMAAKHGHGELVSTIIELRPSLIFSRNAYGNTPLHLAALLGDVNIVMNMLEFGLEACSARNNDNQTPLHLACRSISMEAASLIAEKTRSIGLDELKFAISSGSICIAEIILDRFPKLAKEEAWEVEGGSLSTLLHHACDRGDIELTSILLGLDQRLEEALNTNGLSPLHLAVLRGSVLILEEFLDKAPLSFATLTPSKETVFHLAARNKNIDAFVFMASVDINSQILMQQTDANGNTVLHIAASMASCSPLIRYIVGKKIVDINYRNTMGLAAFHLLPQEAEDFELLSTWLKLDTELDSDQSSEEHDVHSKVSNPYHKRSLERVKSLDISNEVTRLLKIIETNTSEIAQIKRGKKGAAERGRRSLEYEMHIEALQNARNTIAIVAVLIASVSYAGGINPPGGVYEEGPWRGKSMVGRRTAFKVFAICNNIALFTSLCIVILLVSIIPYKRKPLKKLLVATHRMMWVSVGFMATAFVAASWVTIPHYHGTSWLFPAIVSVAGGSLTVLFSYLGVETIGHWFKKTNRVRVGDFPFYIFPKKRAFARIASKVNKSERGMPSFAKTSSDLAASEKSGYFTY
uniref:Ankyrin repeat-containing protein n=1 Tax=Noccaea caerulescens TaxID=107243 RepID=A0A1J3FE18_NOCCA